VPAERPCYHCGEPLPPGAPIYAALGDARQPMCCIGCKAVAEFIHDSGLDAFYAHRSAPLAEYGLKAEDSDWRRYDSEDVRQRFVHEADGRAEAIIEIGGMYCSACVWLLDNALKELEGVDDVSVNPATRRAIVRWQADRLSFAELLAAISRIGFKPQPRAAGIDSDGNLAEQRTSLRRLIVAAAAGMQVMMFAVALYAGAHYGIEGDIEQFLRVISLIVCLPIVAYSAKPFFMGAIRGLRARSPGMDVPVALAISAAFIASMKATLAGSGEIYFDSVAMFVLFLSTTRYIEMRTRHRSDDLTQALANMLPETVTRIVDGNAEIVALDRLTVGDTVLLRPGDVVPADGEVVSGSLEIDESLLTGESMPVHRETGMSVCAGSINRGGNATVRITLTGANTSLAETTRLLERARADRPQVAVLADRIAGKFVVGVLALTALTGVVWLQLDPSRAFEIVLATLVVTCPCALALATPAALATATSRLARRGFLLVRSRVLEVLPERCTIVFDKTGTLTEGRPTITATDVLAEGMTDRQCLAIAAAMETRSEHVLARAFAPCAGAALPVSDNVRVVAGSGVEATIGGRLWRIGNESFVRGLSRHRDQRAGRRPAGADSAVYLGNADGLAAIFTIGDGLRSDAADAIERLQRLGYGLVIASGDQAGPVEAVAAALRIDDWHASLSPTGKLDLIASLRRRGDRVVMVGDGINDAPVLAAADASIAIDAGTALARASADAVVPGKRLGAVVDGVLTARRTRDIIRQNIAWAIGYNLSAVPLAAAGLIAPWMAAIGMSLSSLLVVGNATRLRRLPLTDRVSTGAAKPARIRQATT
jgi:Cu2+-exporting ATPase